MNDRSEDMIKRMTSILLAGAVTLSLLAACQNNAGSTSSSGAQAAAAVESSAAASDVIANALEDVAPSAAVPVTNVSVAAALADNSQPHDDAANAVAEDATAVQIRLAGDSITVSGSGVTIDGSTAVITEAGTYNLSGSLADGQIVVDTKDEAVVRLILNGVDIHSAASAPIYVRNAEAVAIVLADGAENFVSDGAAYVFADPSDDEPNAAIFSKADLTIGGSGALTVEGNCNDGIASKDGLVIAGGAITVTAADDGMRGKDYLVVEDGEITVTAGGDGLKSDNEEDAAMGYVAIEGGEIDITAGGDAITAQTDVLISGGELTLTSGGGSNAHLDATVSAKGIKGQASVAIDGGTFVIDAADDAIHSNDSLTINGGDFTLASGDDAMHADATLTINDGVIRITKSYEGIESAVITINGGDISVVASDDGVNVAGGNDGSGMAAGMPPGGRPGRGGGPGMDAFTYTGNQYLYIHGGNIVVEAAGDGIDVNGAIEMTGGVVIVNGPTQQMNGALDYDGGFKISGGYLAAAGSAGMAQAPGASSSQYSLLLNFPSALPAGSLIHIQTSAGENLLTFAPSKTFQSIAFSSPALQRGDTIQVYYGGSATGTSVGGVYMDGTYTPGDQIASFTVSNVVTQVGSSYR
jgi:hypothetical protein